VYDIGRVLVGVCGLVCCSVLSSGSHDIMYWRVQIPMNRDDVGIQFITVISHVKAAFRFPLSRKTN
jgi:hypothetical protein